MMKKSLLRDVWTRLTGGVTVVFLAVGVMGSQPALAGIASTKHNLGSTNSVVGANKFDGTGEICVFCHTPHGADTSAAVPLWNRSLADPTSYTTYNSLGTSSLDGATSPVGSVSIACLSCHDGVTAMSTVINAPGSGSVAMTGTWSGSNVTAAGLLNGAISKLGVDLQNDHPIGIQYAGGPSGASIPAAGSDYSTFKDPDFNIAKSASLNSTQVWWVDTGTTGRQKSDIQLYTRGAGNTYVGGTSTIAATTVQPFVECASCHDPHIDNGTTFLRVSNTGSAVCLACHIK
jgi:predicted CXXCH cytochrome family protein